MSDAPIKKKVCMLGTLSVGKSSLVRRFVHSTFSERYKTTIGVKIDTRRVRLDEACVDLVLWDMEGTDRFQDLRQSHLRGAGGYVLVADGTRPNSLAHALAIRDRVHAVLGDVPGQLVINKRDLRDDWCLDAEQLSALHREAIPPIETSALSGENVERMFESLARRMLAAAAADQTA